jgi:thiamine biosynthesis lipoprotein ApbE
MYITGKKDNIDNSDYIDIGGNIDTNGQQPLEQKNQEKLWRIGITKTFGHFKKKILEL